MKIMADRQFLESLLESDLKVTLSDGRIFEGKLASFDRDLNLILQHSTEKRPGKEEVLKVGMVMVPGEHLAKAELREVV